MSQLRNRLRLLASVAPAYSFIRKESSTAARKVVTLDSSRDLYLERLTGETPTQGLSPFFSTLEEGLSPTIPRLTQMEQTLEAAVDAVLADPEAYGVELVE